MCTRFKLVPLDTGRSESSSPDLNLDTEAILSEVCGFNVTLAL